MTPRGVRYWCDQNGSVLAVSPLRPPPTLRERLAILWIRLLARVTKT